MDTLYKCIEEVRVEELGNIDDGVNGGIIGDSCNEEGGPESDRRRREGFWIGKRGEDPGDVERLSPWISKIVAAWSVIGGSGISKAGSSAISVLHCGFESIILVASNMASLKDLLLDLLSMLPRRQRIGGGGGRGGGTGIRAIEGDIPPLLDVGVGGTAFPYCDNTGGGRYVRGARGLGGISVTAAFRCLV